MLPGYQVSSASCEVYKDLAEVHQISELFGLVSPPPANMGALFALTLTALLAPACRALSPSGAQWINLQRLRLSPSDLVTDATNAPSFPQFNFTQPLDHFTDTGLTFNQRYWVSDRHYKPGGPVIVLDGGETSGAGRLVYMDTGIVDILTNATNGLGVVLEHRYYGDSIPVQNFTTDSMRSVPEACLTRGVALKLSQ